MCYFTKNRRNSEDMEAIARTTQSKLVLDLGTKIEQKSGAKLNFASGTTIPVEEWIPEKEMAGTKAINLRTAAQTKQRDGVTKLQQFNPSFFLVEEHAISCRVAGCSKTMPRMKPSGDSPHIKQDLFLCEIHRTKLANLVSKRCEEENVIVSVASFKHEDFSGYTSLIGELEKAFMHLIKKPATLNMPQNRVFPNSDLVLAEVFLNARNFLTITHTLLNPNDCNVEVALRALFVILDRIMAEPESLERLVKAFQDIMDIILNFFGIIYPWVKLDNPGEQVGGGVGLAVGGGAGIVVGGLGGIAAGAVGLVAGNLIGGGVYAWYREQQQIDRQNQRDREYQQFVRQQFGQAVPPSPLFYVPGNATGDLILDMASSMNSD